MSEIRMKCEGRDLGLMAIFYFDNVDEREKYIKNIKNHIHDFLIYQGVEHYENLTWSVNKSETHNMTCLDDETKKQILEHEEKGGSWMQLEYRALIYGDRVIVEDD